MPKIYRDIDVYTAALDRFDIALTEFDACYLAVSGGKDSSVMLQLAAREARRLGKKLSVMYIDLEAQYSATIAHINELIDTVKDVTAHWYWIAMPLALRNAVSAIRPKWMCWDKSEKSKWVRPYPTERTDVDLFTEDNHPPEWDEWFRAGMEFEEFMMWFAKWFSEKFGRTAVGVAIRADESLNRFRTIVASKKESYKDYGWTTRLRFKNHALNCWNFYPLYDWRVEDDWIAVARLDLCFNEVYELMYKNGVPIGEQRLCQPYGDDQRKGLDQYKALEPDTWERVLRRVEGVNFGNIYCKTALLGNLSSEKPDGMTWEQYAVFLLETLDLYAPDMSGRFCSKIEKILAQVTPSPELWRRISRMIEKNDYWMKTLSVCQVKNDADKIRALKSKYVAFARPERRNHDR